ncbi:putative predicted protein [Rhizobium favelukesii]|uniref:Uncharacterized protein n=2 Tax=Rhizobium TaxID=379 RepID=W6RF33_9HYPH|nr:putative predicted protein [Rhizobium favelukesii]
MGYLWLDRKAKERRIPLVSIEPLRAARELFASGFIS